MLVHIPIKACMEVAAFEPVTLSDFPGRLASLVFTYGCNLRCRFCHNPELVNMQAKRDFSQDFYTYLDLKKPGAVAITGGEPLFSPDIIPFLIFLQSRDCAVKLDTNGFISERLKYVVEDERLVQHVAMDVKGLNDDELKFITRKSVSMDVFFKSFSILQKSDIPFELRLTVWKDFQEEDIKRFADVVGKNVTLYLQHCKFFGKMLDKRFSLHLQKINFDSTKKLFEKYMTVKIR